MLDCVNAHARIESDERQGNTGENMCAKGFKGLVSRSFNSSCYKYSEQSK